MQTKLYPAMVVPLSRESLLMRRSSAGHHIYLATLAVVACSLAAMPLVKVAVGVQSQGAIRPVLEKQEVRTRASGLVTRVLVRDNQHVRAGDTLFVTEATEVGERESLLSTQIADRARMVADLSALTALPSDDRAPAPTLQSSRYQQEYTQFGAELSQRRIVRDNAARERARTATLVSRGFASQQELDARQREVDEAKAQETLVVQRWARDWNSALVTTRRELAELRSQREQLGHQHSLSTVLAPVDGTVELVQSIAPGTYVVAGSTVMVLSPTAALVADVQVSPRDIGMIRVGTPVRFQVDAFNYREWGIATGEVTDVSSDFTIVENRPYFRVRCRLNETHLALRNGMRGDLRKGMTLSARFIVAERSIFQLLYDDVDDWLNPTSS